MRTLVPSLPLLLLIALSNASCSSRETSEAPAHVATIAEPLAWFELNELSGTGAQADDYFGTAVAIDGDTAIIGAPNDSNGLNEGEGSAYIFVRSGTGWVQQTRLFPTSAVPFLGFGVAVDIEGDVAVVGASGADITGGENQGAVYLFRRSGTTWTAGPRIVASDRATNAGFGSAVDLSGDTLLVGAPYHPVGGKTAQGAAYVYTDLAGNRNEAKLVAPDGAAGAHFGISVALDGDRAVVGAPDASGPVVELTYRGAAYAFERTSGTWSAGTTLIPAEATYSDNFGSAVAISGTRILASSPGRTVNFKLLYGAAYFFTRGATTWTEEQHLLAGSGDEGLNFGRSLAISDNRAFVGAPGEKVSGRESQGAVHTYEAYNGTYFEGPKLTPKAGKANDRFGSSLDVSGDTLLAGAPYRAGPGNVSSEGTAFTYGLLGANGDQCDTPDECGSGYCVDNHCCGTACTDACYSCSVDTGAQTNGICDIVRSRPGCGIGAGGAGNGGASSAGGASSSGGKTGTGGAGAGGVPANGGTTSSGGAVSSGGATSAGGSGAGTGGAAAGGATASGGTGANGGASGGQSSNGGADAAGGATSTTGGASAAGASSSGGAKAAGGTRSNDGGSAARTGGTAGSSSDAGEGSDGAASSKDDGGCSCRLAAEERPDHAPTLLAVALGAVLVGRRRSRHSS